MNYIMLLLVQWFEIAGLFPVHSNIDFQRVHSNSDDGQGGVKERKLTGGAWSVTVTKGVWPLSRVYI